MIASNLGGGVEANPVTVPLSLKTENAIVENLPSQKKEEKLKKAMTVEEYVRSYFSDIPVMVEIARCESRFRQYDDNGEVLRGEVNSLDRGVMQINEYYHLESAEKLGYNILTIEGNTAYARYIFEKYGVQPWSSSMHCWGKSVAYAEYKELALK